MSYLDLVKFPQSQTTNIIVEMYEYSHYYVQFLRDISHMVVDYSYDCTSDDNIHQTASITLHVETDDQNEFFFDIHRALMQGNVRKPSLIGAYRTEQNYIGKYDKTHTST